MNSIDYRSLESWTSNLLLYFILPYTDVCIALYTRCFPSVCGKNFTGDSGGIRTHDLLLTSADVLTSQPPSLPDDDWPARNSSGFRDIRICWLTVLVFAYQDPTNLTGKHQRHQAFESELSINQTRIGSVREQGEEMITEEHYQSPEIERRLAELNELWSNLITQTETKSKSD